MNPRSFPKRLDSKTSCLRITVPENLDLALEGLIRKVLRDQPGTDDIYAFAADYFDTLLRIRDKAGAEYTATQLCPFHNDDEAREMIVLAGTFPKQIPGKVYGKGDRAPLKAETKKETEKAEAKKEGVKRPKESLKESKAEEEKKQATPDLIKKLPVLGENQGLNGEKATDAGADQTRAESETEGGDDEEYLTSDPIKEFVEKELLTGGTSKEKVGEGKGVEPSEGGAAEEKKGAEGGGDAGAADVVTHAKEDGGRQKMESEPRETDGKEVEVEHLAKDREEKIGEAGKPEAKEETQQEKEKEKEDKSSQLRAEEESQKKNSEGVESSPPGTAEEPVQEVSANHSAEVEVSPEPEDKKVPQGTASSEGASPQEKGIAEIGGPQPTVEDKTDAQTSTASATKTDEEFPESDSSEAKPVEKDDARASETEKSEQRDSKEAIKSEGQGEGEEPRTEAVSETVSSGEGGKDVQEKKEGGASFEEAGLPQTKGVESSKGEADEPDKADVKSSEGVQCEQKTSGGAEEAEHAAGQPLTGDLTAEAGEEKERESSGKLDPNQKVDGPEMLNQEELSHSHLTDSNKEAESKRGEEAEKAVVDKKLSDEEKKAKVGNLAEEQESPDKQTSREELPLQKVENVQCAAGTQKESTDIPTPSTGISPKTEEPKREEQGEAKQEVSRDGESPTEPGGTPEIETRDTESAEPQEFKTEEAPTVENETALLASEELCSVVDIDHLKKVEGNQEEPKLAKPPSENAPEEKSALEPEVQPSPSTSEDLSHATANQEPVKPETDKEEDSAERTSGGTWKDPSTEGKQVIIVEEPETTKENPEKSSPPGEIQIKTIQTHYYDTLRVPEAVTREYRVHEMVVPRIDGLMGAPSPPPTAHDDARESPAPPLGHDDPRESPSDEDGSGRLTDSSAFPPTPKTSPASDGGVPAHDEAAEARSDVQPPWHPSTDATADALLALDGSRRDAQPSDSEDLPHPTTPISDVASNFSELSLREGSETFLANEKRFSSLEKEGIRFVTAETEEPGKGEPEGRLVESGRDTDEAAQTPAKMEASRRPDGSSGGLSDLGPADGASAEPPPREDPDAKSELRTVDTAEEPSHSKTQGRNVLESCPEEDQGRPTADASYAADADAPTSEANRADSARREFASGRGLSSARSLDLGKRSPLLRTRSLSTHRHGVADFEVWSTIERELEEAATKIQSKFRGYNTRKKLRREVAVQISTEESSKRSTPEDPDNHSRATGEFHDGIVLPDHPR